MYHQCFDFERLYSIKDCILLVIIKQQVSIPNDDNVQVRFSLLNHAVDLNNNAHPEDIVCHQKHDDIDHLRRRKTCLGTTVYVSLRLAILNFSILAISTDKTPSNK
jgi:hypothetical protein